MATQDNNYDIVIAGSGPLAASAAYFLTKAGDKSIALITNEPADDQSPTYRWAGGSIRYTWPDAKMEEMTTETAAFVRKLAKDGVDLSLHEDHYWLLHRGQFIPSINLSGAKLTKYLLDEAKKQGLVMIESTTVTGTTKVDDGYSLQTSSGDYRGSKVLLAMGAANRGFMPGLDFDVRTRQLYVLDVPVTDANSDMPHTVVPIADGGFVFVFIKDLPEGKRFVLGQEDIIDDGDVSTDHDYFQQILDGGVDKIFPFLTTAKVERVMWGIDMDKKLPLVTNVDGEIYSVNCGSAVRSSAYIGRTVAEELLG